MRIIALFNLKDGVSREDYESWARERDLPGVRSLVSVDDFNIYRATGVLFQEGATPPYQYVEVLDVTDMEGFMADCAGDLVKALAPEMAEYTQGVTFLTTERLSEIA